MIHFLRISLVTLVLLLILAQLSLLSRPSSPTQTRSSRFHVQNHATLYVNVSAALHLSFNDTPVSPLRPSVGYERRRSSTLASLLYTFTRPRLTPLPPLLTAVTITRNPPPHFIETADALSRQTLRRIRWLIINDHSNDTESYDLLVKTFESSQTNIPTALHNSSRPPGFLNGRLHAMWLLKQSPTPFIAFLDDDDLVEPTFYEKCILALTAMPSHITACGSYVVGFGANNYTWTYGFHDGYYRALKDNPLTGREVLKLTSNPCKFKPELDSGLEDWDFYLCMAARGLWGITIPEFLTWYRRNPTVQKKARWPSLFDPKAIEGVRSRWASEIDVHASPNMHRTSNESVKPKDIASRQTQRFENPLHQYYIQRKQTSLLVIFPRVTGDRQGRKYLRLAQMLVSEYGFRLTVVTFLRGCEASKILRHVTGDVLTLSSLSRVSETKQLLSYIIASRKPSVILSIHVTGMDFLSRQIDHPDIPVVRICSTVAERRYLARSISAQRNRNDLVFVVVVHAGWMGKTATSILLKASQEAAEKLSKDIAKRNGAIRMVIVGIGKGTGIQLREVERSETNLYNVEIIPEANQLKLKELDHLADVISVPFHPGVIRITATHNLDIGRLNYHSGTLLSSDETVDGKVHAKKRDGEWQWNKFKIVEALLQGGRKAMDDHKVKNSWEVDDKELKDNPFIQTTLKRLKTCLNSNQPKSCAVNNICLDVDRDLQIWNWATSLQMMGIYDVQQWLQGHVRSDFGERYRLKCGEYNDEHRMLVDLMESGVICSRDKSSSNEIHVEKMQESALQQCGRWCIIDLTEKSNSKGWAIREGCGIEAFNSPRHKCAIWFRSVSNKTDN